MTRIDQRTVLFADLRGSTALYEAMGNAQASEVVTHSVSLLAQVVAHCDGKVVKTLGDGLMAVFETPAQGVQAADNMHEALARPPQRSARGTGGPGRAGSTQLQVALAHGELIELSGDVFGDAVNVAARLIDHAGDNETLVTSQVAERLDPEFRSRLRNLDKVQLRGRVEPVQVFLLDPVRFGDTAVTAMADLAPVAEPEGIRLSWRSMSRVYAGAALPLVLGRSPQASFCIDDARVSRTHARIDWHGGAFQLTDLSYNGTHVSFGSGSEVVSLRRGTCTLHGNGVISLGAPPQDRSAAMVQFEVIRFSETMPQIPVDLYGSRPDDF